MSNTWQNRVDFATRQHKAWSRKFRTRELELFYEGFHYKQQEIDDAEIPPITNMFFATIETKMPGLVISNPRFSVTPRPKTVTADPEGAFLYAQAIEDVINDWLSDPSNCFASEMEMAIFDAWFGFGIMEIGYSAGWIENKLAQRPPLENKDEDYKEKAPRSIPLPESEQLFVRHIPFDRFLVSGGDYSHLTTQDWVGYWEYVHYKDLMKHPKLRNKDYLNKHVSEVRSSHSSLAYQPTAYDPTFFDNGEYVKLHKIWDIRSRRKKYFCFDLPKEACLLFDSSYDFFPFFDLRFKLPRKGFYPIPITFNWISPQVTSNEVRADMDVHRKRFRRVYTAIEGQVEADEIDKLRLGEDGTIITVKRENAIIPLATMAVNPSMSDQLVVAKSDFDIISGTTAEQRGEANGRVTATQAQISDNRASRRESREKQIIGNFYRKVAAGLIRVAQLRLVKPVSVAVPNEANEQILDDIQPGYTAKEIDPSTDFGPEELEYSVDIRVQDSSPFPDDVERTSFLSFLSLITQFGQMALSPTIVREMAARSGYRNERVIRAVQQMSLMTVLGQIEQGTQAVSDTSTVAQNTAEAQLPPDQEMVDNELASQGLPITQESNQ